VRSFGLTPKTLLVAAVFLIPLLAAMAGSSSTAPPLEVSSAAQSPVDTDQPNDRGSAFGDLSLAGAASAIESQDRRSGRRIALEGLNQAAPATADGGNGRWTSGQLPLVSWVTTLTAAGDPCSVLCCFRC
jgi:hypothetical protein